MGEHGIRTLHNRAWHQDTAWENKASGHCTIEHGIRTLHNRARHQDTAWENMESGLHGRTWRQDSVWENMASKVWSKELIRRIVEICYYCV